MKRALTTSLLALALTGIPLGAQASSGNGPMCGATISASWDESHAVRAANASPWGFGQPEEDEFGAGFDPLVQYPTPQAEAQLTGAVFAIDSTVDSDYTLALKTDGTVWAVGHQDPATAAGTSNWTQVSTASGMTGVVAISAGDRQGLALKGDGTVWDFGDNTYGQLGDGATGGSSTAPVEVHGAGNSGFLTGVVMIASGHDASLALKGDGTVWSWGSNGAGQLGNAVTPLSNVPVQVSGLTQVTAVAAGQRFGLALKQDGTVWAWGLDNRGQLGTGAPGAPVNSPVQVHNLGSVTALAAGAAYSLALKGDGSVWAWGANDNAQLGDGTQTERDAPVQVLGAGGTGTLGGIIEVSAGGQDDHSLALRSDGTVWAWGFDASGQLGDGSTVSFRKTPVQVTNTALGQVPGKCLAVTAVSPGQGGAGSTATLTGSGFLGATAVHFGGVAATSFTVVSDTRIDAQAPSCSGTVDVTVTTARGTTQAVPADHFGCVAAAVATPSPTTSPASTSTPTPAPAPAPSLPKSGFFGAVGRVLGSPPVLLVLVATLAVAAAVAAVGVARRRRRSPVTRP